MSEETPQNGDHSPERPDEGEGAEIAAHASPEPESAATPEASAAPTEQTAPEPTAEEKPEPVAVEAAPAADGAPATGSAPAADAAPKPAPPKPKPEPEPEPEPEPSPIVVALTGAFPSAVQVEGEDQEAVPIVRTDADNLVEVMTWLRDDPEQRFDYLANLTAIDWTEREPRFDMVYNLYSISHRHRLTVKCGCADGEGVPTMCDVWRGADWIERETYDLYGIEFLGHPGLRRIFLSDDWEGFPLRKDYPLEGPNLELLTRQQAAFRGGRFDRIRGEHEINEQERQMAGPGIVGALWTPTPPTMEEVESDDTESATDTTGD